MAKAGNLKLYFMAKSIKIHPFGFEDIFRCYRDAKTLKKPFGRMDTLKDFRLNFSNSLIIHQVKTTKNTTVREVEYPVLISIDFEDFTSPFTP